MKAYDSSGNGGTAPLIINVGGDIHASAALLSGKEHPILVDREFGWAPELV